MDLRSHGRRPGDSDDSASQRRRAAAPQPPTPKEPWLRRTTGWFAGIVWCGVAVAWNVGIIGWQLKMAHDGRGWSMLILIPWSLIGWFLMGVLFVELGIVIDSAIGVFKRGNHSSGESWKR